MNRDAINKARILYYGFFGAVFSFSLDEQRYLLIGRILNLLEKNPVDKESAAALAALRQFLADGGYKALKEESDALFFSPASDYMPVTASYYDEGRDDGAKRLEMMGYVKESDYRRNVETFKENEDHVEFFFIFMQRLINDELAGNLASGELALKVFKNILNGMLNEFILNLFTHEKNVFYKQVAVLLRSFTAIERMFLGVEPPKKNTLEGESAHYDYLHKEKKPTREIVKRNFDEFDIV